MTLFANNHLVNDFICNIMYYSVCLSLCISDAVCCLSFLGEILKRISLLCEVVYIQIGILQMKSGSIEIF